MWRFNTAVGDITLDVDDKWGHHSVFGHIPVQKEKYYIIRIMKWSCQRQANIYFSAKGK
jgi:hypothetical protein